MTLIYGFINSVILALVALGFNLTFGISGVSNFAYGALYIMSGYIVWILINQFSAPFFVAALVSVTVTAILGALLYRLVLLRVRGQVISEVIATFGVGLAILELFRFLGFTGFEYTLPPFTDGAILIGNTYVDHQRLWIVGAGVFIAIGLYFFTHHTKIGLAFRGIAQEEKTALSLGINSDFMAGLSVAFGSGLAAVAAIVILPRGTISVNDGYDVLINAMAVCIVGGLGSTVGVVVASFIIGYAQMATDVLSGPHWKMIVSLIAIFVILIVKPSGLFGKQKELEERI
ncbi:MAG: branched-chain amino acid transport system permease protein [Thermodesulfobacteriota bacterium]|nr:branched-chain amino acid transport system permease protein [Thermodesulfobacteriota bacterium]